MTRQAEDPTDTVAEHGCRADLLRLLFSPVSSLIQWCWKTFFLRWFTKAAFVDRPRNIFFSGGSDQKCILRSASGCRTCLCRQWGGALLTQACAFLMSRKFSVPEKTNDGGFDLGKLIFWNPRLYATCEEALGGLLLSELSPSLKNV